jgi:hypothetical protein
VLTLLAALLLRLGWCLTRPAGEASFAAMPDQFGYLHLARSVLAGDGMRYLDERFGQMVYAARAPGYPLFLAALGGSVTAARVAQALIDTSTVLAVFLLARRWLPVERPAFAPLVAAALVAFNPFLVFFTAQLLTETSFTAMLAWAMVLLSSRRRFFPGIVLLALSVHVRPSAVGLVVALPAVAAWATARSPGGWHRGFRVSDPKSEISNLRSPRGAVLAASLAGALMAFAVLLPWAWRNHEVLGRWVWSTTNDGITAYDGVRPGATGASDQSFTRQMPELRDMGELERNDTFARLAKAAIREDPGRLVPLTLRKLARTWSPLPLSAEYGGRLYLAVGLCYSLPFDLLVLIGLLFARPGRRAALLAALPALYFTVVHSLSVGSLRYRVPAEPPLAVLAAAGAAWLASRVRRPRHERHERATPEPSGPGVAE